MKLIPYVTFNGQAEEAMNFYADVLGGEVVELGRYSGAQGMPIPEGYADKVLHGRVKIGDLFIYFSDVAHREIKNEGPISLTVEFDSEEKIDNAFAKLSEGGNVQMPLDKTFWGAKYGKLSDKFGIQWDLNYQYQS